ncbi:mammalian cell entry protein [Mycolicibacter longobardus]|uniref:mammalian cell entry protein n=1 Tax=Mycolicibacter longobardus TaxID=1108812 RepID=UPI0021F2D756|nr:mammalian cell entry protein [Mycolicibacter longobardus]MCV7385258.1 mammalian cell entry protein [Mycolicibacter longobardus]
MADHADAPERIVDVPAQQRFSRIRVLAVAGLVLLALAGALGWLGHRDHQVRQAQAQREQFVQVARQAAINLTTISYTQADADVQRIIDSATGAFQDDFSQRSQPFLDVVKRAQSESEGTVTEAGLESVDDDRADVLLAVSVRTSIAGTAQPEPRRWRMRISLQRTDDGTKVSNLVFVP